MRRFPGFSLRPTRWGGVYLGGMLVFGLAAVNTGNNALMALLGIAVGSYVVSGVWSRQVLGALEVRVIPPREAFAGQPAEVRLELVNGARRVPAYAVVLRDADRKVLLVEELIPGGGSRSRSVTVRFAERGWQRIGPWRVEVLLPLGFFVKSKEVRADERVLVYPRPAARAAAPRRPGVGRPTVELGEAHGREGDVIQLRDYREGDEMRQLHWKQTARQRRPVVVDRQRPEDEAAVFVVDDRLADPDDPVLRSRFEQVLGEVTRGVLDTLAAGRSVGLVIGNRTVAPRRGRDQRRSLLLPLAEAAPRRAVEDPPPARPVADADVSAREIA